MDSAPAAFEVQLPSFQTDVIERSQRMPVLLLFWTERMPESVDAKTLLERLAGQYAGKVALGLSDIAKDPTLAQQLRVQAIPSLRVIRDGQVADQLEGPQSEAVLRDMLDRLTQSPAELLKQELAHHLEAGDFDGALAVLRQALAAEPHNAGFKVEWADLLLLKGDLDGARKVLATIPDDADERERPANRLALLEEATDMGTASAALGSAEADPDDLDARYRAAVLLTREHRYEDALEHALAILVRDRTFRDDLGRLTMIRIMSLLGKGSDIAKRYRRRMFNFLH